MNGSRRQVLTFLCTNALKTKDSWSSVRFLLHKLAGFGHDKKKKKLRRESGSERVQEFSATSKKLALACVLNNSLDRSPSLLLMSRPEIIENNVIHTKGREVR